MMVMKPYDHHFVEMVKNVCLEKCETKPKQYYQQDAISSEECLHSCQSIEILMLLLLMLLFLMMLLWKLVLMVRVGTQMRTGGEPPVVEKVAIMMTIVKKLVLCHFDEVK